MKTLCRVVSPVIVVALVAFVLALSASDADAHGGNGLSLRVSHSGKCMDLKQASQSNGAKVQQYQCHGGTNQRVEIIHQSDGYHSFKFLHSNKCLASPNSTNGAQLEQQTCSSRSPSQRFTFIAFGAASGQMQIKSNGKCVDVQNGSYSNSAQVVQVTCSIYSSSQLWGAREHALFCCRLNYGPFGRYWYFVPTNPSWYESRVDSAVASWNNTGTTSFSQTTNYYSSVVDFYVLNPGTSPPYDWAGVTAFWVSTGNPAQPCDWEDGCAPNTNWGYADVIFNEGLTGPGLPSTCTQAVGAHEFGHAISVAHTGLATQLLYSDDTFYWTYGVYAPQFNDTFNADVAY